MTTAAARLDHRSPIAGDGEADQGGAREAAAAISGAVEMVYDKKNALVIGFCPDERASNVINSVAVYSKWINLYFFEGDALPDPEGLLQGSGSMVRHIRVTSADDLDRPAVKALMARCAEMRRSAARYESETANPAQAGRAAFAEATASQAQPASDILLQSL